MRVLHVPWSQLSSLSLYQSLAGKVPMTLQSAAQSRLSSLCLEADTRPVPCCSSLLPLPYAFSKTGIVVGLFLMTVSALTNAFTARLVLEAGHATGRKSYEGVAEAVGGRRWKVNRRL